MRPRLVTEPCLCSADELIDPLSNPELAGGVLVSGIFASTSYEHLAPGVPARSESLLVAKGAPC
jgi:hypothetical protein